MKRRANLPDDEIDAIVKRIRHKMDKSGPEPEQEAGSGDGTIILLDEDVQKREARLASRVVATVFDTKQEMKTYLKKHPDADPSEHSYKEDVKKGPGEQEAPEQNGPEQKPGQKKEAPRKMPEREILVNKLESAGEDAKDWSSHALHKSQLTRGVNIKFPDGTTKKYGDLSDDEKKRVQSALESGQTASKGLNDYSKVDVDTMKHNMANNLALYDSGGDESKNDSKEPVTKENVKDFGESLKKNAKSVLDRYAKSMSKESRAKADRFVDEVSSTIQQAVDDGSLSDVSQADLDEYVREDVKRLLHQEVETRRRSLGDHGIRHAAENAHNTLTMMDKLAESGVAVTGKDKLMAMSIQANHDQGYTVGNPATSFAKGHQANSETLAREESDRYEKVFGNDGADKMASVIGTHDKPEFDWESEPMQSAVRLADNTALFGKEKVQDLFIRSPDAMGLVCKMRLAVEADPKNKELQDDLKKQMHDVVDKGDFDDVDKELMHAQVDEMSADFTSKDILSRFSGRIEGFKFDRKSGMMDVDMAYSPEGQIVDSVYGDSVATNQFAKFTKDMGSTSEVDEQSIVTFGGEKPVFRLNMKGYDEEPIDAATTDTMKDFAKQTARADIMKARTRMMPPPEEVLRDVDAAFDRMKKSRDKFNDDEWSKVEALFKDKRDTPKEIVAALASWPLLESERKYLGAKKASTGGKMSTSKIASMIVSSVVFQRFAQLSKEDKDKVVEKVKEKLVEKGEAKPEEKDEEKTDEVKKDEVKKDGDEKDSDEKAEPKKDDVPEEGQEEEPVEEEEDEETKDEEETEDVEDELEDEAPETDEDEIENEEDDEDSEEDDDEPVEDAAPDLSQLVNDLAGEISEIKSDGKIAPSEVIGLVNSIVTMVNTLLMAKPGRARKSSLAQELRERRVVSRMVE